MSHTQFTKERRVELAVLLRAGKNNSECARILGMNRSSIGNEITLNKCDDGVYRGLQAHKKYLQRRKDAKHVYRTIENNKQLRRHTVRKLKLGWSPEQIAGRLKRLQGHTVICHETIYTFVYEVRPELVKYLRRQKNKYRRKRGSQARIERNRANKIKRIEERPAIVETRERIGDWEGDTVVGKEKTQRILTYVERKSGYALAEKLDIVTAEIVEEKTEELFLDIPVSKRLTLTRDNGVEFGDLDRLLEERTGMEVYRATPYHSWERGTNENWNGLLRQFFPKGTNFATITSYEVKRVVKLLNNRPRKRLGYMTPREYFRECCDSD
jgi:transposase, IS30 family